jgi:hypothetical protein
MLISKKPHLNKLMKNSRALLLSAFAYTLPAAESAKRSNIVFCFAADWGRHAGAYGNIEGAPA